MSSRLHKAAIAAALSVVLTVGSNARADSHCPPAVSLTDATETISEELSNRRIVVANESDCGVLVVSVSRSESGELIVRRTDDPESARTVGTTSAAATVIESWVRSDLADPLLATRAVRPDPLAGSPEIRFVSVSRPAQPVRRLEVATAGEIAVGGDGSTWTGLSASGCVNVHIVCVGAMLRGAIDNRTGGESERLEASRYGLDMLLIVDLPLRYERLTLYPGLGVGQGGLFTYRDSDGDGDELAGVRVRARVGISVPVRDNIAVTLNPEFVWTPGNPRVVVDEDEGDEPFIYPGDPGHLFRLGIGLRMEAL